MILSDIQIKSLVFLGVVVCLIFGISSTPLANSQEVEFILEISFSPPAIESGEGVYSIGYVNIVNDDGNPLLAPYDLTIQLISEDPSLVLVPEEVLIPLNADYASFDINVTDLEGMTEVIAIYGDQVATTKFSVVSYNRSI